MSDDPRHGRRQKKRKADPEIDPEFQIAPMIDILLVLLVFFMSITSTEVLQTNQSIKLPVAKDAKESKTSPGQVIVNVLYAPMNNATSIEVDEKSRTPDELIAMLQTKANLNPQLRVLLRADKEVRYETTRTLLENIGKAGVGTVTFSVVDKETPK